MLSSLSMPFVAAVTSLFASVGPVPHAKPRLVAETRAIAPGTTAWIGLTFEIEPGWHIYWEGQGDTGQPPKIDWTLPPGFEAGQVLWPAPARRVSVGDILDYVYENRATLLVPVTVPAGARPGERAKIMAKLWWLECEAQCVPRDMDVSLSIPIGEDTERAPEADQRLFADARRRMAKRLPSDGPVRTAWRGDTLEITVPGAERLLFYPHRSSAVLRDPIESGEKRGEKLNLDFDFSDHTVVRGILEVRLPEKGNDHDSGSRNKGNHPPEADSAGRMKGNAGLRSEFYAVELKKRGPDHPAAVPSPSGGDKDESTKR